MSTSRLKTGPTILIVVGVVLFVVLVYLLGTQLGGGETANDEMAVTSEPYPDAPVADSSGAGRSSTQDYALSGEEAVTQESDSTKAVPQTDQLVIMNGTMDLRVESVEDALESARTTVKRYGAEISNLTIQSGTDGVRPLQDSAVESVAGPASAYMTIRVAAAKLEALQTELAKLGKVVTQSASADDVTQEYIDLSARLKNLKAEEARLRSFLRRTDKVSELLEVERELSRVRGEIEAMQAQVDYLERQAAKATLVLTLTEPGPVIRPDTSDWGFIDAITRGIQGAAAVLTTLITGLIALSPVLILVAVAWFIIRWLRRRGRGTESEDSSEGDDGTEG